MENWSGQAIDTEILDRKIKDFLPLNARFMALLINFLNSDKKNSTPAAPITANAHIGAGNEIDLRRFLPWKWNWYGESTGFSKWQISNKLGGGWCLKSKKHKKKRTLYFVRWRIVHQHKVTTWKVKIIKKEINELSRNVLQRRMCKLENIWKSYPINKRISKTVLIVPRKMAKYKVRNKKPDNTINKLSLSVKATATNGTFGFPTQRANAQKTKRPFFSFARQNKSIIIY